MAGSCWNCWELLEASSCAVAVEIWSVLERTVGVVYIIAYRSTSNAFQAVIRIFCPSSTEIGGKDVSSTHRLRATVSRREEDEVALSSADNSVDSNNI